MDNGVTGPMYIKSQSGMFKLLQFIFSLSAFVSIMIYSNAWKGELLIYFDIVSLFGMLYSIMMVVMNVANLGNNFGGPKIDTIVCIIFSIFAFTSASILAVYFKLITNDAYRAAIVLEFFAGFAYLGNAITKIM